MVSREDFAGSGDAPQRPLKVYRVEPGTSVFVRMLSTRYHGIQTHWNKGRSWYCTGTSCSTELHKTPRYWKGYAAAEVWDDVIELWQPVVLEITESLELDLRNVYQRGQIWVISRLPQVAKAKTPVTAKISETRDPKTIPPSFDVTPVLRHLYHVEALDLTIKNPLPERVMVRASTGDGPAALAKGPDPELVTPEVWAEYRERLGIKPVSPHVGPRKPKPQ